MASLCGTTALVGLLTASACGDTIAVTSHAPRYEGAGAAGDSGLHSGGGSGAAGDGGFRSDGGSGTLVCSLPLSERVVVTPIELGAPIAYIRADYSGSVRDERIATAARPNGELLVAWRDLEASVHVLTLDDALVQVGDELVVSGSEVGGVVALQEGGGLLLRRGDPNRELLALDAVDAADAVHLVRFGSRASDFDVQLSGPDGLDGALDYSNRMDAAQLAYDAGRFAAYFSIRGGAGHASEGSYADKLVLVGDAGEALSGGFSWGCSLNYGARLLRMGGGFAAFCMSDGSPAQGLNVNIDGSGWQSVASEYAVSGRVDGSFGTPVIRPDGGAVVVWSSKQGRPAPGAPDVSMIWVDDAGAVTQERNWLTNTPSIVEDGVHAAPYGESALLLTWNERVLDDCSQGVCWGTHLGMRLSIVDYDGALLESAEELLSFPAPHEDALSLLPNGDIVWAMVQHDVDYGQRIPANVPERTTLTIVRMPYCP